MALSFTPDPAPPKLSFVPDGGEVLPDVDAADPAHSTGPASRGGSGRELARRNGSRPVNSQEFDVGTHEIEAARNPTSYVEGGKNLISGAAHVALGSLRAAINSGLDLAQYGFDEGTPGGQSAIASLERGKQNVTNLSEHFDTPDVHAAMGEFAGGVGKLLNKAGDTAHSKLNEVVGQPAGDTIASATGELARPLVDVAGLAPGVGAVRGGIAKAAESSAARAGTSADTVSQVAKAANIRIPPTIDPEAGGVSRAAERVSGSRGLHHEDNVHNQKQINTIALKQEAGIDAKPGVVPTVSDWAKAKAPHNKVYNQVANSIEPGATSPEFAAQVSDANGKGLFAGDDADVASKISKLTNGEPVDGQYLVNASRELRSRGYRYENSQDAVIQDRGTAYLKMADAIDDEMGRRLPPGGPVTIDQFKTARRNLAKVHEVQAATVGPNVDIARIARTEQKRPGVLDGGLKVLADVGNTFPTVTGLISRRVEPTTGMFGAHHLPTLLAAGVAAGGHAVTGGLSTAGILGAQYGLRRALTSGAADVGDLAANPKLARFFPKAEPPAPPSPLELKPPPGPVIEPHQPQLLRPDASGVTAAESSQVPRDSVRLVPPLGEAFDAHQPGLPFNEPLPPGTPSARGPGVAQNDLGLRLTTPAEDLPPISSTATRASAKADRDALIHKLSQRGLGDLMTEPDTTAYHGSPTKGLVELKPGAGGAARGHGIYLSEDSGVSGPYSGGKGQNYKVSIPADQVGRMMKWDEPLSSQPDVKAAFEQLGVNTEQSAGEAYRELSEKLTKSKSTRRPGDINAGGDKAASEALAKAGIPGIKYSASGKYSQGGSNAGNFVVFDSKHAKILPSK